MGREMKGERIRKDERKRMRMRMRRRMKSER